MTAYKLKKVLDHIKKYAYPDLDISSFYVEYVARECITKNASYHILNKKITIYNFSRPITNIMCSAIHELAHHICYETSRNKNHDMEFYKTFKTLLTAAVEIGYVDYELCRKVDDTNSIKVMEQKLGKLYCYCNKNDLNKNYCTIQVVGGYDIKNYLMSKNFHYSPLERIWEKDIHIKDKERYEKEIREMDPDVNIVVSAVTDLTIQVYYRAKVTGKTYGHKEVLAKHGYYYRDNCWQKKFEASEFQEEYLFLKSLSDTEFKIS